MTIVCLLLCACLGKYFPTPEVGVVPETIKDHDTVLQGNNYSLIDNTITNMYR